MNNSVRRGLLLLGLLFAGVTSALAQQTVRGQVVSAETRQPMSGVAIRTDNRTATATTNAEGRYQITVPAGATSLVFSALGFGSQEVAIAGRSVIDVALQASAVTLDELVVVGYTTQERRTISGAVASVTAEELKERPVATVEQALQGRIAGVNIVNSGEPGRPSQVIIRGQNFIGDVSPLYVVDGMYLRQNPNLDPNDIASIEVLKDASAASQYGAQAANGVIVITTKRGRTPETQVQFSTYYGFQDIPRKVETMRAAEYVALSNAAHDAAGRPRIPAHSSGYDPSIDTDWQEELFQRGAIQNHNLTLSGSTENANYLISGGFLDQVGAVIDTDFRRYNLRINSELRKGRFTIGENLSLSRAEQDAMIGFPLIEAMMLPPTLPVRDPNNVGGFAIGSGFNPTFGTNPIGMQETIEEVHARNQMLGTLYAGVELLSNLNYRFNFGFVADNFNWRTFEEQAALRQNNQVFPGRLWQRSEDPYSLLFENLLTFDDSFGAHDINAVAGYTEQKTAFNRLEASRWTFPFAEEGIRQINAGASNIGNVGFMTESALRSFLFRTNYAFADRYLATVSFRRDGSSRFGPENKWGNFGAVSLGWVLSEESFFPSIPLLGSADRLKIRGSYGTLGNQDIGDYQYAALINQGWGTGYIYDQQLTPGGIQVGLANTRIRWQENTMANVGFDMGLFGENLSLTADYYVSESGGLLVQVPLPPSLGVIGTPYSNVGSVRNSGFELGLQHRLGVGDFGLNSNFNLTTTKNRVLTLGPDTAHAIYAGPWGVARTTRNLPIGHWYLRKMDGIFQSEAEVQAHRNSEGKVIQPNARPGDVRWADLNDDGLINDDDRYVAGSGIPELEANLFFDGNFRRFDFSLGIRGSYGAEVFNVARFWRDRLDDVGGAYSADLQPWTPENRSTTTPRAVVGEQGVINSFPVSDRWLEDGSYLRIQTLNLGYRVPNRLLGRVGVDGSDMRLFVNMNNLHTFTRYTGWDPEAIGFNNPLARGLEDGRIFPNVRTISVGAEMSF